MKFLFIKKQVSRIQVELKVSAENPERVNSHRIKSTNRKSQEHELSRMITTLIAISLQLGDMSQKFLNFSS